MAASGTQSVDRAAELLSLVVLADAPPAFAELVSDTGLAKSTASRLLQALERHRLVHRIDDGGYEAGPLFALYASRREPIEELITLAMPTLEAISEATGETVNLAVVRGNAVVQVAQIDARFLLGTTNWVDVDVPPHCSALGKVFYAEGAIPVPTEPMESRTAHTLTDPAVLARQLRAVGRNGYAETSGELEIGLDALATPVRDHTGKAIAAIGVSGPSDRIQHQRRQLGELLASHARELSAALGYRSRKEGAA